MYADPLNPAWQVLRVSCMQTASYSNNLQYVFPTYDCSSPIIPHPAPRNLLSRLMFLIVIPFPGNKVRHYVRTIVNYDELP